MTNKEKLFKRSNCEIASLLGIACCGICAFSIENHRIGGHCNCNCKQGVLIWLNSEVEEYEIS